ncbi:class F sortase [Propioniferax innocua]|uniref:Sortase family protein n=1 Tax=Propioniferax innocua TaxID=1753 RepID=A0A542ZR08_9ACTN|nr:class F sortase [Propioniferax innocua]TQL62793.1 sortase family protein [Propioniferax innocua]
MMRRHAVVLALLGVIVVIAFVVASTGERGAPSQELAGLPEPSAGPVGPAPEPEREWSIAEPGPVEDPGVVLEPGTIEVPSLGIVADLESTRVEKGEFLVPPPAFVGVHRSGTADDLDARLGPGPGTILASGHVTWNGELGSLYELHRIEPGTLIHTSDTSGRTETWQAVELRLVPFDEIPADVMDAAGTRRLVLVTCAGEVTEDESGVRRFAENLIVTALPVSG